MATITDFVEEWIQIRSMLQRQLKIMEAEQMHTETGVSKTTIIRIKSWIDDLNSLLKEYAAHRT